MSWFDDPSAWDKVQGRKLLNLLAGSFPTNDVTAVLLDTVGAMDLMKYDGIPKVRWHHILTLAHTQGRLRHLLDDIAEEPGNDGLKEQFATLSLSGAPVAVGNPPDPYQVRLLGPRQLPLVDRASLRAHVRRLVEQQYPVLVIRDILVTRDEVTTSAEKRRSGKSFSFELINHVVRDRGIKLTHIDLSSDRRCTTAADVMQIICRRLRLSEMVQILSQTTAVKHADELVDYLVGEFEDNTTRRIIIIDGLDRTDFESGVHELVVRLAIEVTKNQLPLTQLVVTGYRGDFGTGVQYPLVEEIVPITEAHVREFFEALKEDLTPGVALDPDQLNFFVMQAMTHVGDIEKLALEVRQHALTLVGDQ